MTERGRKARSYRPPRDRRELMVAIACVIGVLLVTGLLIWLLAPDNQPDVTDQTPISLPTQPTPTQPTDATTTVPTAPAAPGG